MGLPIIIHFPEFGSMEDDMVEIPCPRGTRCKRCSEGRAGYTFRWFSSLWLEGYMQLRRDDTWLPGYPEGVRVTPLPGGFIGELLDAKGYEVEEMQGSFWSARMCCLRGFSIQLETHKLKSMNYSFIHMHIICESYARARDKWAQISSSWCAAHSFVQWASNQLTMHENKKKAAQTCS